MESNALLAEALEGTLPEDLHNRRVGWMEAEGSDCHSIPPGTNHHHPKGKAQLLHSLLTGEHRPST